jgi:hypothetical protein
MDVLVLIDKLDDLVHGASTFPMTDKVMIDRDEIYDLLDQAGALDRQGAPGDASGGQGGVRADPP